VGLYEKDAEVLSAPVDVFRVDFKENDRSLCDDDTVGFVKIFVERSTDKIVGATICGSHAGDMISGKERGVRRISFFIMLKLLRGGVGDISEITLAISQSVGLSSLATVIHPYPTKQDAVRRCGDLYNRTKLSPAVKIVFRKLMTARRGK
jgi:hypothetical protein